MLNYKGPHQGFVQVSGVPGSTLGPNPNPKPLYHIMISVYVNVKGFPGKVINLVGKVIRPENDLAHEVLGPCPPKL